MKFGMRTPNLKKSIKARTTGRIKRTAKKAINPLYGKKGMGYIKNPKKAVYNKVYNKTSFGVSSILGLFTSNKKSKHSKSKSIFNNLSTVEINDDGNLIYIYNKKEAMFMAEQWIKIANDCANIVNTTKNPDVFFERFNLLIKEFENMSKIEKFGCFKGTLPSENLSKILANKENSINDFIDRFFNDTISQIDSLKTIKAKERRIDNFYNKLSQYNNFMTTKNINKYTSMFEEINNKQ